MRLQKNQKGLTFISWLIILAVGGFFVMLALKLTPIYLENQSAGQIIIVHERGSVGQMVYLQRL